MYSTVHNMAVHFQKNSHLSYENFLANQKRIEDVWKGNFKTSVHSLNQKNTMTWTNQNNNEEMPDLHFEKEEEEKTNDRQIKRESPVHTGEHQKDEQEPSHHARRPMNAFLIFCKKHRPIVRKKYPSLENRGVTRILGEWWALLDSTDKEAYTNLAKEYKDAFFTANPNFKWYKLPAPPLRPTVIAPKPLNFPKETTEAMQAQFTPGKLADESQLGLLSSLLTPQPVKIEEKHENLATENNNNEIEVKNEEEQVEMAKPLKKRRVEQPESETVDTKPIDNTIQKEEENNVFTQQNLLERVVDNVYLKTKPKIFGRAKHKETRTSGRSCKGKRYAEFMKNGKLLKNKRDKRSFDDFYSSLDSPESDKEIYKEFNQKETSQIDNNNQIQEELNTEANIMEENPSSAFNLELRIDQLPSLSYDLYLQKKRDSKKRKTLKKLNKKPEPILPTQEDKITGSKKRKNKNNITHLYQATGTNVPEKNKYGTNILNKKTNGLLPLTNEKTLINEKEVYQLPGTYLPQVVNVPKSAEVGFFNVPDEKSGVFGYQVAGTFLPEVVHAQNTQENAFLNVVESFEPEKSVYQALPEVVQSGKEVFPTSDLSGLATLAEIAANTQKIDQL